MPASANKAFYFYYCDDCTNVLPQKLSEKSAFFAPEKEIFLCPSSAFVLQDTFLLLLIFARPKRSSDGRRCHDGDDTAGEWSDTVAVEAVLSDKHPGESKKPTMRP